jgi:hypothetical protein
MARAAGRGLPWFALLAISASAAHGMTARPAAPPAEAMATAVERPLSIEPCDLTSSRMLRSAVSNGWLSVEFGGYCRGE